MKTLDGEQRDLARDLFGSPCRVILAAFAWERGADAFSQKEAKLAAEEHGSNMTQMVKELDLFARLGLLERSKGARRNDPVLYAVDKQHRMWEPLVAVANAFGLIDDDTVTS